VAASGRQHPAAGEISRLVTEVSDELQQASSGLSLVRPGDYADCGNSDSAPSAG
jgi:hypothetical protein